MTPHPQHRSENLFVRLVPWRGTRLAQESLVPAPNAAGALAFGFLGDMQFELVVDEPGTSASAAPCPPDLEQLGLTPSAALSLAAANVRRLGGAPRIRSLGDGVYGLEGAHPEYGTAGLLDRAFWRNQLGKFPHGLLAALPRRGVLMFAPAGDPTVQAELSRLAGRALAGAGTARLSACLYRFDAGGWHLHSDLPVPAETSEPPGRLEPDHEDSRSPEDDGVDLDKAASGQKVLVCGIVAGFVLDAVARGADAPPAAVLALSLAWSLCSLLGVVRLSSGLGRSTGATIAFMVANFVPLLNLATWIALSVQATRRLRAAGRHVGLLGARP